jgi:hypothetical protein
VTPKNERFPSGSTAVGVAMTSAPNARRALNFSSEILSGMTKMHLKPFTAATMASPMPVFPDVVSMIVPPAFSFPDAIASSTI